MSAPVETALAPERLVEFLDEAGIGSGALQAQPIGDGHSNLTFLIARGEDRFVLRRPPLGPLAPSANDVAREASLLQVLRAAGVRVPEVLAICTDQTVIGSPFYLMEVVEAEVINDRLPAGFGPDAPEQIGRQIVEALANLHAIDVEASGAAAFGRPSGYLERQLRRFRGLLEHNATRPLPALEQIAAWLEAEQPDSPPTTIAHGDYRLGNLMFSPGPHLAAILDWELATTGDPLADLGYLTATWAQPTDPQVPMLDLSPITRDPAFPTRDQLAHHYASLTSRPIDALPWYQALALWKAAIFLEGSYARYLAGKSSDPYFERLSIGVPALADHTLALIH